MRRANEIQQNISDLRAELDGMIQLSEAEQRDLTAAEAIKADGIIANLGAEREALATAQRVESEFKAKLDSHPTIRELTGRSGAPSPTMRDAQGLPVYCLTKDQSVSSVVAGSVPHGLGEMIRAVATGRTHSWTPDRVRAALSGGVNTGGGFLVPSELSSSVVDLARARSVLMLAGVQTIPMTTADLTIARVLSDPEMEVKSENAAFSEASITFGAVQFHAKTIGCVITSSRELAEDAPNFSQVIEGVIARALAAKLDYYGIQGVAPAPLGLVGMSDIDQTGSIGALAWEDLAAGSSEVRQNNHIPNSIVLGVEPYEDLQIAVGGDGVNASKAWLQAPPALTGQAILPTNNCPLANAIIGDFSYAMWGIRTDARIEMTTEADQAFEKHQLKLKITFRGDFQVVDPSAFHRLAGITS